MGYITKEQALAALGLEPEVWCENDPVEIQERNDWYYYRDAIEAVPEVEAELVIKSHWQLVDEKNGTGVCGNCHRQDHIDPLARYCRYCGARLVEEGENMEVQRKCEYNKDGKCLRWGRLCNSLPVSRVSDNNFVYNYFRTCSVEDICRVGSTYGNDFVYITDKDIEALKSGEVLFGGDEYGLFLKYKGEKYGN